MLHYGDAGNAEHLGQLIPGHLERPGSSAFAGRRLGIGCGACCVECDVAFDLLHDLMNVPVQDRNGSEAPQLVHELVRVTGPPSPRLIDGPEWHVGKDHEGRTGGTSLQVGRQPSELFSSQGAEAARLELQYIDQRDKMHASVIKAVITLVVGRLAESAEIFRDGRVGGVVLAWHRM